MHLQLPLTRAAQFCHSHTHTHFHTNVNTIDLRCSCHANKSWINAQEELFASRQESPVWGQTGILHIEGLELQNSLKDVVRTIIGL